MTPVCFRGLADHNIIYEREKGMTKPKGIWIISEYLAKSEIT